MSGNSPADPIRMNGQQHRASEDQPLAMKLLADGVPLLLQLDLAAPTGPDSEVIADTERAG